MLVMAGLSVIAYYYYTGMEATDATNLGWGVIVLFSGILAIHFAAMITTFVIALYSAVKSCKEKCKSKSKNKVAPSNNRVTKF